MSRLFLTALFFLQTEVFAKELRLVSLDPAITEWIFASPLKAQLVGVTKHCNYPAEAQKLPKVGSYNQPQIEKILALKPTHILVLKSGRPNFRIPEKDNIHWVSLEGSQLGDYLRSLNKLEKIFAVDLSSLKKSFLSPDFSVRGPVPDALLVVGQNPIVLAGKNSFLSQALAHYCGLVNLATEDDLWPMPSLERLLLYKPKYVLRFAMQTKTPVEDLSLWKQAKHFSFSGDEFLRLGPRLPDAMNQVCNRLLK